LARLTEISKSLAGELARREELANNTGGSQTMRNFRFFGGLALVLLLAVELPPCGTASGQEILRWKFAAGEKFRVTFARSTRAMTRGGSARGDDTDDTVIEELFVVESVDGRGTAKIKAVPERIQLRFGSPGNMTELNLSAATEPASMRILLVAEPAKKAPESPDFPVVHLTVDYLGRVLSLETNEVDSKRPSLFPPEMDDPLSKEAVTERLQHLFPRLPGTPVVVGQTWKDTLRRQRPHGAGMQDWHVTYRYAGPARYKNATLEEIITTATVEDYDEQTSREPRVVRDENVGVLYFDRAAGRLVAQETRRRKTVDQVDGGEAVREQVAARFKVEVSPAQ
jgi:hypothetical protein